MLLEGQGNDCAIAANKLMTCCATGCVYRFGHQTCVDWIECDGVGVFLGYEIRQLVIHDYDMTNLDI